MAEPEREWKVGGSWVFQWPHWWKMREYNWTTLDLMDVYIEHGTYKGEYWEVRVVLFGVGFEIEAWESKGRLAWGEEMEERIEEAESSSVYFALEDCEECDGVGVKWVKHTKAEHE